MVIKASDKLSFKFYNSLLRQIRKSKNFNSLFKTTDLLVNIRKVSSYGSFSGAIPWEKFKLEKYLSIITDRSIIDSAMKIK